MSWHGRNVLVTGGASFIGSHLVDELVKQGARVRVVDDLSSGLRGNLAQHLDDLAESFLMSAFHGGRLKTMKAHYLNDDGDLRIIRPLVYVRERLTRDFSQNNALPVIPDSCPACFSMPTQRQHMKVLLENEEAQNSLLFKSLLTTLKPLMSDGLEQARETDSKAGSSVSAKEA